MKSKGKHTSTPRPKIPWAAFIIVMPFLAGIVTLYYVFGPSLMYQLANRGDERLVTTGWQTARDELQTAQPQYGPKYAYYKLQEGQDLKWAAAHFGVSLTKLQQLNPGQAIYGTTIIVPPVETPLTPLTSDQITTAGITVSQSQGVIYVNNRFLNPEAYITMPQLMELVAPYDGISQLGPKTYLVNKPLYVQDNIRMDITSATVHTLYLLSKPNYGITTLTFQSSEALFDGVTVTSYDPATKGPDTNVSDGRSFLRAYQNARMDMLNTNAIYLGMTLDQIKNPSLRAKVPFVQQGGVYGVSWRIGTHTFGSEVVTGWVQNSSFEYNDIGAFTFGASGMMWQSNLFTLNRIYGLDPHDDSNNATIEYNRFVANGKHGFIVSKRCDYNTIKDNISIDNKLHGFMLHDNSDYNIFENNIAIGNYDNFVLYGSNFNTVTNNKGYSPRDSQVRINEGSVQNYVINNAFYGGKHGVYLYGGTNGVLISNNLFNKIGYQLVTNQATRVLFSGNQSNNVGYKLKSTDRVVFGENIVNKSPNIDMKPLDTITDGQANHVSLPQLAATALKQ